MGYLHDTYYDNFERAIDYFRKAVSFGAGDYSFTGLARSLAQLGRKEEALQLLDHDHSTCQQSDLIKRIYAEIQNGDWDPIVIEP